MISVFLSAVVLSFLTVAVHATGITVLIRGLIKHHPATTSSWLTFTYCRIPAIEDGVQMMSTTMPIAGGDAAGTVTFAVPAPSEKKRRLAAVRP